MDKNNESTNDIVNESEQDIVWVDKSPHEDIAAAFNSLMAVDGIDEAMLSKAGKKRVEQIKRWSLRLIHHNLKEIYTETEFDADTELSSDDDDE